ncbi:hypothetical protein EVAR_89673_1 [Eumeta japonica]|uniref:Uncharacterized protein n=1 Tax=Eumeta variegata TaxID=151549 RepID=A0A4C1YDP7_EUMVA|nr:hypothetical protein EVAR_89673_1 [Eumeta japonica]
MSLEFPGISSSDPDLMTMGPPRRPRTCVDSRCERPQTYRMWGITTCTACNPPLTLEPVLPLRIPSNELITDSRGLTDINSMSQEVVGSASVGGFNTLDTGPGFVNKPCRQHPRGGRFQKIIISERGVYRGSDRVRKGKKNLLVSALCRLVARRRDGKYLLTRRGPPLTHIGDTHEKQRATDKRASAVGPRSVDGAVNKNRARAAQPPSGPLWPAFCLCAHPERAVSTTSGEKPISVRRLVGRVGAHVRRCVYMVSRACIRFRRLIYLTVLESPKCKPYEIAVGCCD